MRLHLDGRRACEASGSDGGVRFGPVDDTQSENEMEVDQADGIVQVQGTQVRRDQADVLLGSLGN